MARGRARIGSGTAGRVRAVARELVRRRRGRTAAGLGALLGLATGGALLLAAQAADAAVDGGALTPGTSVTLSIPAGTTGYTSATYTADVPAGKRFVLTAGDSATPLGGSISATAAGRSLGSQTRFGNRSGDVRLFDVDPATTDRTLSLSLQVSGAGDLPLTPSLADDPAAQPLAWSTPTTATVAAPGQQATLTFQGVAGHRLGVTLTGSTFPTVSGQPGVRAVVRWQRAPDLALNVSGPTAPGTAMIAVPYTLVVDGIGDATGSVTVRIDDVTDVTGAIESGVTGTAELSTIWTQVAQKFQLTLASRIRFEVLSSTLRHADGTPGSAKVTSLESLSTGYQVRTTLGTVADQPVTFAPDTLTSSPGTRTLEIVPDGRTTGTISYRLTVVEPVHAGALGYDTPTKVTVPAGAPVLLTLPVTTGARITLAATGAALTADSGTPELSITSPRGLSPFSDLPLTVRDGASVYETYFEPSAAGDVNLLVSPTGTTGGSVTLTAHRIATVTAALVPGTPVTARAALGDTLRFTAPAGADLAPALTLSAAVAGVDGVPQNVDLEVSQNGSTVTRIWDVGATATTRVLPRDLDPTQPWQLEVVWATRSTGSAGSVTAELAAPHVTTGTLRPGTATTVAFAAPGDAARLALTTRPGQRITWRSVASTGVATRIRLTDASGAQLGRWDETFFGEIPAPASGGTVTFTLENLSAATGTDAFTAWAVTDPVVPVAGTRTISWGPGQNPRLTFRGTAGTHAILDVTKAAWSYQVGPYPGPANRYLSFGDPVVLGPDGTTVGTLAPIQAGTTTWGELAVLLPATGTYTIVLDPDYDATGSITASLRLPADQRRTAVPGVPLHLQAQSPGQNVVVTVDVPAGGQLGWRIRNSRFTEATMRLERADGVQIGGATVPAPSGSTAGAGSGAFTGDALAAGTYRVVIDPAQRSTGTAEITLTTGVTGG